MTLVCLERRVLEVIITKPHREDAGQLNGKILISFAENKHA